MNALKKSNLKAKRLTQVTQYSTKGKFTTTKWEDVDVSVKAKANGSLEDIEEDNEKLFASRISSYKNAESPLDKTLEMMENIKRIREDEISRICQQFLGRDLDEKQKLNMKKVFRFLFGRKEGEKGFFLCFKNKIVNSIQLKLHF